MNAPSTIEGILNEYCWDHDTGGWDCPECWRDQESEGTRMKMEEMKTIADAYGCSIVQQYSPEDHQDVLYAAAKGQERRICAMLYYSHIKPETLQRICSEIGTKKLANYWRK